MMHFLLFRPFDVDRNILTKDFHSFCQSLQKTTRLATHRVTTGSSHIHSISLFTNDQ
jgi:hypothetical protein